MRFAFAGRAEQSFGRDQRPKNSGLVITLCILASAILWFMFSMQETYTQFFDFPTTLENIPPDQALASLPPSTIRVQVEGQGVQLLRLYYQPPTITLDATTSPIDLAIVVAKYTGSVRMESVTPAWIELPLETKAARRIPIRPRVRITAETGYQVIGVPIVNPDSVTISGARSIIENLEFWPTKVMKIDNARALTRIRVPFKDTLAGLVDIDAIDTEYHVDILPFTEGARQIEIRVEDAPAGRDITFVPASTTVTFQVPLPQFDRALIADDFYASIPYEEIRTDTTGTVYPGIHLPDGLVIRESRITPDAFGYYFNLPEQQ